jgi:hypothetical protein
MFNTRMDWRKPGRDYLDPELEEVMASSLIEIRHPRQYRLAAFQVGTASMVAGMLLLLLSAFGSTVWTAGLAPEMLRGLLMPTMIGIALTAAGALFAGVSRLVKAFSQEA